MRPVAQFVDSELNPNPWTVSNSPELAKNKVNNQEIIKIFSQPVANHMQGMCRFENGYEQLLPLFRGLILLGKPNSLSLIYDLDHAQVFFTFSKSEEKAVVHFFNQIIELLMGEVKFKEVLSKVIENNRRFQAEQSLLQSALHGVAWD